MVEGQGVILKGGEVIGLAWMAGVAGLGQQRQIGQLGCSDQTLQASQSCFLYRVGTTATQDQDQE